MAKRCVIGGEPITPDSKIGTMKDARAGEADFILTNVGPICAAHIRQYREAIETALCEAADNPDGFGVASTRFVNKRVKALIKQGGFVI